MASPLRTLLPVRLSTTSGRMACRRPASGYPLRLPGFFLPVALDYPGTRSVCLFAGWPIFAGYLPGRTGARWVALGSGRDYRAPGGYSIGAAQGLLPRGAAWDGPLATPKALRSGPRRWAFARAAEPPVGSTPSPARPSPRAVALRRILRALPRGAPDLAPRGPQRRRRPYAPPPAGEEDTRLRPPRLAR